MICTVVVESSCLFRWSISIATSIIMILTTYLARCLSLLCVQIFLCILPFNIICLYSCSIAFIILIPHNKQISLPTCHLPYHLQHIIHTHNYISTSNQPTLYPHPQPQTQNHSKPLRTQPSNPRHSTRTHPQPNPHLQPRFPLGKRIPPKIRCLPPHTRQFRLHLLRKPSLWPQSEIRRSITRTRTGTVCHTFV